VLGIFASGIGRGRSRDGWEKRKGDQNSESQNGTRLHVASLKNVVAGLNPKCRILPATGGLKIRSQLRNKTRKNLKRSSTEVPLSENRKAV
jgi:hypothetical protein